MATSIHIQTATLIIITVHLITSPHSRTTHKFHFTIILPQVQTACRTVKAEVHQYRIDVITTYAFNYWDGGADLEMQLGHPARWRQRPANE